jgi:transcription initiation factor TFIID subunit 1
MKDLSDLSATNGQLMLVSYAEKDPPLIAKVGMGAKRVTYYRRKTQGDTTGRALTHGGTRHVVDLRPEASSPFISELPPGQPQEALETTLFRAPIFQRRIKSDEGLYILIRGPHGELSLREVTEHFVVGQEEPHVEVFQPNTDRLRDFEERAVNAACIFSLLKQRADRVPESEMRVKVSDIEKMFHRAIQGKDIKRRIRQKILLPVRPPGSRRRADDLYDDDADEFELNPTYRFEDDLMLHRMCPPEDVCAFDSMRAARSKLERGRTADEVNRIRKLMGTSATQMLNAFQMIYRSTPIAQRNRFRDLELMLQLQPWAQTTEFLAAVGGRAVLHLDASRKMREKTGKFYHYVRRQPPKDPDMPTTAKVKPGTVTGTDADLRKLTMPQTERILTGFGVPLADIKKLHRWKRIGLIRELSGAATADKNAAHEGLSRFARSLRVGIAQQMQEQNDAANKIYKAMRKQFYDKKAARGSGGGGGGGGGGSSDESDGDDIDGDDDDDDESSSDESESDDSLADELEGAMDKDKRDGPDEDEERRELEEMRRMMKEKEDAAAEGGADRGAAAAAAAKDAAPDPTKPPPGKRLQLKRIITRTYPDGRVEKIEDDVSAAVGDAWMKARRLKDDGKTVDLEAAEKAVMTILYPNGVEAESIGIQGDGGAAGGASGAARRQSGEGLPAKTIKAPNFHGTLDEKEELIRLRKRTMEKVRRRRKKLEELKKTSGVSQQDLAALAAGKEASDAAAAEAPRKSLKIALSLKKPTLPPPRASGGGGKAKAAALKSRLGTTSRFRNDSRDGVISDVINKVKSEPKYQAFCAPVTRKILPDYDKFVSRKMDLGTISRNLSRGGGYVSVDAVIDDVKQIATNARLYHEADEDVFLRVPEVPPLADALVEDFLKGVENVVGALRAADATFDIAALAKALGRDVDGDARAAFDAAAAANPKPTPGGEGGGGEGAAAAAAAAAAADGQPAAPPVKAEPDAAAAATEPKGELMSEIQPATD